MRSTIVTFLSIALVMIFLSSGLVNGIAGASGRVTATAPPIGGSLTVATGEDPGLFMPWVTETLPNYVFDNSIWAKLLTLNAQEQIVGDLAQSWTQSANLESFVFNLNPNAMWTDGVPVTSADVEWDLLAAKNTTTTFGTALQHLVSVETPTAHEVIVNFSSPTSAFIFANYESSNDILPEQIYNNTIYSYSTNPADLGPFVVGDGPFIMTHYVAGQSISFEANPNYFGGRPYLNNMTFLIIPSLTTAIAELQADQIGLIFGPTYSFTPSAITQLEQDKSLNLQLVPGEAPIRLAFNNRTQALQQYPFLANVDFREAIAYAINDSAIISAVLNNTVAPSSFYAEDQGVYDPNLPTIPYNPSMAEQLLNDVGLTPGANGVRLSITIPYYGNFGTANAMAAVQQMLQAVGIDVTLVTAEADTFLTTYWEGPNGFGTNPIVLVAGATGPNPLSADTLYDSAYYPVLNGGNVSIGAVNALFTEAQATTNQTQLTQIYDNIQQLLAQYLPAIPLYTAYHVFAAQSDVQGLNTFVPFTYEYEGLAQLYLGQAVNTQSSSTSASISSTGISSTTVSSNTVVTSSATSTTTTTTTTTTNSTTLIAAVVVVIIIVVIAAVFVVMRRRKPATGPPATNT